MDATKPAERQKSSLPILSALVLACLGIVLAYFGYVLGAVSLNVIEFAGTAMFWFAVVYLLLESPLHGAARTFSKYVRTTFGMAVFALYMAIHLLLYGFLLEAILASIYGSSIFAATPGLFITTNVFLPPSLTSAAFDLAYNPTISITAPPVFSAALSFYSVSVALVIAILVIANLGKTKELGALRTARRMARTFVVLPALGIVLGASCCISVAGLLSLASPAGSVLTSSPWIYYATYFLLPCVAMVLLYLNLRSVENITAGLKST